MTQSTGKAVRNTMVCFIAGNTAATQFWHFLLVHFAASSDCYIACASTSPRAGGYYCEIILIVPLTGWISVYLKEVLSCVVSKEEAFLLR